MPRLGEIDGDFVSTGLVRRCITLGRPVAALSLYVMTEEDDLLIPGG